MKRFLSVLLAIITLLTLILMPISCNQTAESADSVLTTEPAPATTDPEEIKDPPTNSTCEHRYTSVKTEPTNLEKGFTTHTCDKCGHSYVDSYVDALIAVHLQYDDYVTSIGEISATSETATLSADNCLEIISKNGKKYFHAKDTGTVTLTDGKKSEIVVIDKARLHFVVIMGQSNAGCHFLNATSDVKCKLGTAYWWGSSGASTKSPSDYISSSMGFHAPLVAELHAQSVAAGAPEKIVMIWAEGVTSKNGNPITSWAASKDDTSGTDDTVKMIQNCVKYYTMGKKATQYEIVESGVYWLQGESDAVGNPILYQERFMAMWARLKGAGMNYMAFFRVRRGVGNNKDLEDRNDLIHHESLLAQMEMINRNKDMYLASTITEHWIGTVDTLHSIDISNYITMMETYGASETYSDRYGNTATFKDGILTTSMKELYGHNNYCHYGKFGYGILGADAAYNMYRALRGNDFAIVCAGTKGMTDSQKTGKADETVTVNIKDLDEMLTFRPACYSMSGMLTLKVLSGTTDITENAGVISNEPSTYHAIDPDVLKNYTDVTIEVTYTPLLSSMKKTVLFKIVSE